MRTALLMMMITAAAGCWQDDTTGGGGADSSDQIDLDRVGKLVDAIQAAAGDDRLTFDEVDDLMRQVAEPQLETTLLELVIEFLGDPPAEQEEVEEDDFTVTATFAGTIFAQTEYYGLPRDVEIPAGAGQTLTESVPLSARQIGFGGDTDVHVTIEGTAATDYDLRFKMVETHMTVHVAKGQTAEKTASAIASKINQQRVNIVNSQFGDEAFPFDEVETFLSEISAVADGASIAVSTVLDA